MQKTDNEIRNESIQLASYIMATNCTVRQAAAKFNIPKSTVWSRITRDLSRFDKVLTRQVRKVLNKNKKERHLRGGLATKLKYQSK